MLVPTDLKNGIVFRMDGQTFVVVKYEHVRAGQQTTVKVRVKNVLNGVSFEKSFSGGEKLEEANVGKQSYQYLYADDNGAYFMDLTDYNQITLPVTEDLKYLKEGEKVVVLSVDGEPVSFELPKSVELAVRQTDPGTKGNTVNKALKPAILETGFEVNVPMFVNIGDVIKINTDSGEYLGRV